MLSCMAILLYCERGACGPDGAGSFCCSSDFFNESRRPPPLVGGAVGFVAPSGCDCEDGTMMELGLRS
jgi:hypothetical protein